MRYWRAGLLVLAWMAAPACLLEDYDRCEADRDCPQGKVCEVKTGRCIFGAADGGLDMGESSDGPLPAPDHAPSDLPPGQEVLEVPSDLAQQHDLADEPPDAPPDPDTAGCIPVDEVCDGLDNDCDDAIDEGCHCLEHDCRDVDCDHVQGGCGLCDVGSEECNCNPVTGLCEPSGGCPRDMVPITALESICIDRFEAMTEGGLGASDGHDTQAVAYSAFDMPPQTSISWHQASKSCENAGKALCTKDEWYKACAEGTGRAYPYGNDYLQGECNDTYYSDQHGTRAMATGRFPLCVNTLGVYDLSGNVMEWTATPADPGWRYSLGGHFSANNEDMLRCGDESSQTEEAAVDLLGFRCCCALGRCP